MVILRSLEFNVSIYYTIFSNDFFIFKKRMPDLEKETQCPAKDCELSFKDRIALCNHYQIIHNENAAPCGHCLKIIKKSKMRSHMFNDHSAQKYVCQICFKALPYLSHLKQHTQGKLFTNSVKPIINV